MSHGISTTDAINGFPDYLGRVVQNGESFVVMKDGHAVAEISPALREARLGDLPKIFAALPRLAVDDADQYAADLADIRASIPPPTNHGPWA